MTAAGPDRFVGSQLDSGFRHVSRPQIVLFGRGSLKRTADLLAELGVRRAAILTTPQQRDSGEALMAQLGGLACGIYSRATMHTPVDVTADAVAAIGRMKADGLVAIGGGSTTGLSKAISVRTGMPQLIIPTTYAGSEMTPILGETENGIKQTRSAPEILPSAVIYDVELTLGLPAMMTATSALNAIAHAVEGLYARDRNPIISMMALEGIRTLAGALPVLADRPGDIEARLAAQYGAWLCGHVLGSVGMALHHKLCHALGGSFNLPHAETHSVILPHATAYNEAGAPDALSAVAALLGADHAGQGLYDLAARIGAPMRLADIGMAESDLDRAADIAAANPYYNPVPVSRQAIRALLDDAFFGRRPQG